MKTRIMAPVPIGLGGLFMRLTLFSFAQQFLFISLIFACRSRISLNYRSWPFNLLSNSSNACIYGEEGKKTTEVATNFLVNGSALALKLHVYVASTRRHAKERHRCISNVCFQCADSPFHVISHTVIGMLMCGMQISFIFPLHLYRVHRI